MKKLIFLLLSISILFSEVQDTQDSGIPTQEAIEQIKEKQKKFGWSMGVGFRGVWDNIVSIGDTFFGSNVGVGLLVYSTEKSYHSFTFDFGWNSYKNWDKSNYCSALFCEFQNGNGYGLVFDISWDWAYAFYKSDVYRFETLVGLGIGGQYTNINADIVNTRTGQRIYDETSASTFLLNINMGIRNVLFKNHAIDFRVKSNLINATNGVTDYYGGMTFVIGYTFLNL